MQDTVICYLFVGLKLLSLAGGIKTSKVYKASPNPVGFALLFVVDFTVKKKRTSGYKSVP